MIGSELVYWNQGKESMLKIYQDFPTSAQEREDSWETQKTNNIKSRKERIGGAPKKTMAHKEYGKERIGGKPKNQ